MFVMLLLKKNATTGCRVDKRVKLNSKTLKEKVQYQGDKSGNFQLTLFWSGVYQIDTCLPFSLFLRHGFRSESEQPYQNRFN